MACGEVRGFGVVVVWRRKNTPLFLNIFSGVRGGGCFGTGLEGVRVQFLCCVMDGDLGGCWRRLAR